MDKIVNTFKLLVVLGAAAGAVAGWFNLNLSTRRYLVHLGKQVPYLPYRYFI